MKDLDLETVLVDDSDDLRWWEEEEKKKDKQISKEKEKWQVLTEMGIVSVVEDDCDYLFKILVVGDTAVGKTCVTRRYTDRVFSHHYLFTIGVDFLTKSIELKSKKCILQIWDTAGQEKFRTLTSSYYRGAHGIMVVYDVTSRTSFENVSMWLEEIERNAEDGPLPTRVLVGNKRDLSEQRQVDFKTAKNFAERREIPLFEVSAKSDVAIDTAFNTLATLILESKEEQLEKQEETTALSTREVDRGEAVDGEAWVLVTGDSMRIREVPNQRPRSKLRKIGRAVQQECRDRSRMPSSA
eukprot:TRINITY_DN7581_c0_g1_i25.p1 TRINITY_DN7581_c0_g1~~TRINITY_DN7581_c0_g1_i25.p1  ORF type:complete len:336 (+),score=66.93 TRINITY_DN7581_c0_g1_i25:118-1008(+)